MGPENPIIYITPQAKQTLDLYIELCANEISGLGRVSRLGNNLLINEMYLFEQEVTSITTILSQKDIASFLTESIRRKLDPSNLKLWWHSHANMEVGWSPMDDGTIDGFNNDWMLSIVGNKFGEFRNRLDIYNPFRLTLHNLDFRLYLPADNAIRTKVEQELKDKVMIPKIVMYPANLYQQRSVIRQVRRKGV